MMIKCEIQAIFKHEGKMHPVGSVISVDSARAQLYQTLGLVTCRGEAGPVVAGVSRAADIAPQPAKYTGKRGRRGRG